MNKKRYQEFLRSVDVVCTSCLLRKEEICTQCPVRLTSDRLANIYGKQCIEVLLNSEYIFRTTDEEMIAYDETIVQIIDCSSQEEGLFIARFHDGNEFEVFKYELFPMKG